LLIRIWRYHDLSPDRDQIYMEPHEANPEVKGVVGIQNMGNTCYANSTLQLLRACSEWDAFCLSQNFVEKLSHLPETDANRRILLAYQDILRSLWSAYLPAYVRPLGFISEVCKAVKGTVYEAFGMPVPNDSHEYLVYLLDHFHEALKTTTNHVEKEIPANATPVDRMRILAENGWNRFLSHHSSPVVQLFFGMMRKTVQCTNCANRTYQWEVFNSLKVPCEGATLEEWIQREVNEQSEIEGYQCDHCKGRHLAKKSSHLWKLPDNLFVTLHRFNYNGHKNMTTCPYHGDAISFQPFFAEESEEAGQMWKYEIRGVSDHHGTHMGGHYTAQFKHPITQQWWGFDDERARPLANPEFSATNYIFFFKKCA
jgi:ubiquitin C-terminal hydrolase